MNERHAGRSYVGRLGPEEPPSKEYLQYVSASPGKPYRREAINEFRNCLHDTLLNSDDVAGIRKVRCGISVNGDDARSAHSFPRPAC